MRLAVGGPVGGWAGGSVGGSVGGRAVGAGRWAGGRGLPCVLCYVVGFVFFISPESSFTIIIQTIVISCNGHYGIDSVDNYECCRARGPTIAPTMCIIVF